MGVIQKYKFQHFIKHTHLHIKFKTKPVIGRRFKSLRKCLKTMHVTTNNSKFPETGVFEIPKKNIYNPVEISITNWKLICNIY